MRPRSVLDAQPCVLPRAAARSAYVIPRRSRARRARRPNSPASSSISAPPVGEAPAVQRAARRRAPSVGASPVDGIQAACGVWIALDEQVLCGPMEAATGELPAAPTNVAGRFTRSGRPVRNWTRASLPWRATPPHKLWSPHGRCPSSVSGHLREFYEQLAPHRREPLAWPSKRGYGNSSHRSADRFVHEHVQEADEGSAADDLAAVDHSAHLTERDPLDADPTRSSRSADRRKSRRPRGRRGAERR